MAIMQEEIFGPVLPVVAYAPIQDTIAYVNARPRPLALYYFGGDDADRRKVLSRTTSGNVGINNTLMHYAQDDLPSGDVGASGMGAYRGIEGFRRMRNGDSRTRAVERVRSHARAVRAGGECDPGDDAAVVEIRISSRERTQPLCRVPQLASAETPFFRTDAPATATHGSKICRLMRIGFAKGCLPP
jgi:hypothetical protein